MTMKKNGYKNAIRTAMEKAGSYDPLLDTTILTLAGILARRDQAQKEIDKMGISIKTTSREGDERYILNPACQVESRAWAEARKYLDILHLSLGAVKASASDAKNKKDGIAELTKVVNNSGSDVYHK